MKDSSAPLTAAFVLLLLPLLYVASYLALVMPPYLQRVTPFPVIRRSGLREVTAAELINQDFGGESYYRWGGANAERFFWPLEQIDRKLRPRAWDIGLEKQISETRLVGSR